MKWKFVGELNGESHSDMRHLDSELFLGEQREMSVSIPFRSIWSAFVLFVLIWQKQINSMVYHFGASSKFSSYKCKVIKYNKIKIITKI